MSLTESTLEKYRFRWETNPYRIVDNKTDKDVFVGVSFDLRPEAMKQLRRNFDFKALNQFKPCPSTSAVIENK